MSLKTILLLLALSGVAGIAIGYFLRLIISLGKRGSMELEIRKMKLDAEERAKKITGEAEARAKETEGRITEELKVRALDLKQVEERLVRKEELLDKRQTNLDLEQENLVKKNEEITAAKAKLDELSQAEQEKLEKIAGLSADEAKADLLKSVEKQNESDIESRMRKLEIIGKEGRNIRAFERATGVDVIVDDTPGTITLSSYDPIRRQIARIALENLILDGRIQPAK